MASSARRVVIEFLGEDKSASKTARQVDGSTSKLGGKFKAFGKVAAAGFAAAGVAGAVFAKSAISKASDLNETLNKSTVIFGKQAPAMEAWASTAYKSAGLSKQAALESAAGFGDMFSQIGIGGDEAAKMSKQVVQLSADLGSFNNLPTAEVADMMSGAFRGEYDSLQRVIPNINAARVEHEALAMSGKKSADSLTAQEKAMATLAIVQKDGARATGDFARTSSGLANQQKILSAQWDNMQASIGQKLLPIMVKLANWTTGTLMPALQRFGDWFQKKAMPVIREWAEVVRKKFGDAVKYIRAHWAEIRDTFKTAIGIVTALWNRFGDNIIQIFKVTFRTIGGILKGAFQIIRGIFRVIHGVLTGDWRETWNGIKDIFRGALQIIVSWLRGSVGIWKEILRAAGGVLKDIAKGIGKGIWAGLKWYWGNIIDFFKSMPGRIASAVGDLSRLLYQAGIDLMKGLADGIKDGAANAVGSVKNAVDGLDDFIPGHADGIINSPGGLAIVGERGPELVSLPRGASVFSNARSKSMMSSLSPIGGGGDGTIAQATINLQLDGKTVQTSLLALKRRNGGLELGLA